jgi:hypothetical protein
LNSFWLCFVGEKKNHTKLLQSILAMQNNKNGGRVRLKDIQNMLAKDFNIQLIIKLQSDFLNE